MKTSELSDESRRLLDVMNRLWFGHIEGLVIVKGEPVLTPMPRVVAEIKFGQSRHRRSNSEEFALKEQHIELIELCRRLFNGRIERLEVQAGLPFRIACADLWLIGS